MPLLPKKTFYLNFKPEKVLTLKINDGKEKYRDREGLSYQEPCMVNFRDETLDLNKRPYIVCFKPDSPDTITRKQSGKMARLISPKA